MKLILSYWSFNDDGGCETNIIPFNYESKELAEKFLTGKINEYSTNWKNYYKLKTPGAIYPVSQLSFCGHTLQLRDMANWDSNWEPSFDLETLDEWWNYNCKNPLMKLN